MSNLYSCRKCCQNCKVKKCQLILKMASREEWCANKLSKLLQEDLRLSTLTEIKEHLSTVPHDEAARTANVLQLPLVFDCLNDSNTEQVDLACEVLSLCMSNLNIGESTNRYGMSLERALTHPFISVKLMALKEIQRTTNNEKCLLDLCKRLSLLSNIIRCIADEDLSVATNAITVFNTIGNTSFGIIQLTSTELLKVLRQVLDANEIVRLRFYGAFVDISKSSVDNFKMLQSTGLIDQLVSELDNNDVLLKMNVIEILSQLGMSQHGYNYLESTGVLSKLIMFLEEDDRILVNLCEPGILKFFGHILQRKPEEILSKHPVILDRLFKNVQTNDYTIITVTLNTLGYIALTNEGKYALDATGDKILNTIRTIAKNMGSYPQNIKVEALNCIESILRVTSFTNQITNLTKKWYCLLGDDPMGDFILKYAKNPFSEFRIAGLGILNAVAAQNWGQDIIKNTPGLLEFLLDRNVETIKECKEAKYNVVKLLVNSTVFDHVALTRIKKFVNEGPYYVQVSMEVAVDGND